MTCFNTIIYVPVLLLAFVGITSGKPTYKDYNRKECGSDDRFYRTSLHNLQKEFKESMEIAHKIFDRLVSIDAKICRPSLLSQGLKYGSNEDGIQDKLIRLYEYNVNLVVASEVLRNIETNLRAKKDVDADLLSKILNLLMKMVKQTINIQDIIKNYEKYCEESLEEPTKTSLKSKISSVQEERYIDLEKRCKLHHISMAARVIADIHFIYTNFHSDVKKRLK